MAPQPPAEWRLDNPDKVILWSDANPSMCP